MELILDGLDGLLTVALLGVTVEIERQVRGEIGLQRRLDLLLGVLGLRVPHLSVALDHGHLSLVHLLLERLHEIVLLH